MRAATRRLSSIALLVGSVVAVGAGLASAHSEVRSTDPTDGALLQSPPSQVTITFTEAPDASFSSIHVLDSTGNAVELGRAEPVPGRPTRLRVALPASLADGVYTVAWRAVSRTDGHLEIGRAHV